MADIVEKIRAARGLLDWTQADLAQDSGLDKRTVNQIEKRKSKPTQESVDKMQASLNSNGVFFTSNGVEKLDAYTYTFNGNDWYLKLLDDVLRHGQDLIILYADEGKSSPDVIKKKQEIRDAGIKIRCAVKEGSEIMGSGK